MYRPEHIIDVNLKQKRSKSAFESQKAIGALRCCLSFSFYRIRCRATSDRAVPPPRPRGPFLSFLLLPRFLLPLSLLIPTGSLRAICIPIRTMLPTVYRCNALPLLDRRPRASSHDLVKDIEIRILASLVNARLLGVGNARRTSLENFAPIQHFFPNPHPPVVLQFCPRMVDTCLWRRVPRSCDRKLVWRPLDLVWIFFRHQLQESDTKNANEY